MQIGQISIAVPNVDRGMSAYLAANDFRGRRVVIRKIFADQITLSGDACIVFDGLIDKPMVTEEVLSFTCTPRLGSLMLEVPRVWYQLLCNWKFGSDQCGIDLGALANSGDKTIDAGSTVTTLKDSGITEGDDYWKYGEVEFTSGDLDGDKRRIITNSGDVVYLATSLDSVPEAGDTYIIRRGCDKTLLRCSGDYSNKANYGGFPSIPEAMVVR